MSDAAGLAGLVAERVGDRAAGWDLAGELPRELLVELGGLGVLCAQVAPEHGGLGLDSRANGELTASVGELCGSLRSVMTSQGMAAWTVRRLGGAGQRERFLRRLTSGELAAAGFSEPGAGSDLAAMTTTITDTGDGEVVVTGRKSWITAARYADLLVVFGHYRGGASAVVVPADAPGVRVERVPDPSGCRAAGHSGITLDGARVPADHVLGGTGLPLPLVVTAALTYGRVSVAWGCVGILRACLAAAVEHTTTREQGGGVLADHQLVARHLAELHVGEQIAARASEHASALWDAGSPDGAVAAVQAKYLASREAAAGAARAVQLLGSAGASDGHVVARAHRDAKLMEIIEGTSEICQLVLAQHVRSRAPRAGARRSRVPGREPQP
ncbi:MULTISPECIES: acyl-CoA dehydrogenase family protein [Actinosynnema]|uniref:acyl-CoA dehydrogenase family protein n=1 Tax=Actinosynnema TaxID=40566 RepID=UPI0020A3DDE8|nr:acyl-CoA dehydrogenase family protein [Actinosynnema pretiosum]MCP2097634.1 methoxymalonate biosynthesis protein [Actinosynnema pretiosum]